MEKNKWKNTAIFLPKKTFTDHRISILKTWLKKLFKKIQVFNFLCWRKTLKFSILNGKICVFIVLFSWQVESNVIERMFFQSALEHMWRKSFPMMWGIVMVVESNDRHICLSLVVLPGRNVKLWRAWASFRFFFFKEALFTIEESPHITHDYTRPGQTSYGLDTKERTSHREQRIRGIRTRKKSIFPCACLSVLLPVFPLFNRAQSIRKTTHATSLQSGTWTDTRRCFFVMKLGRLTTTVNRLPKVF